ncbi:MAG: SIR2 family NAD-dependent protein deacylase [Candidatus Heimdallarchaeota archaeon]
MSDDNELTKAVSALKELILKKNGEINIVVLTGSGISKGSGIPTFRGKDGLWKNYNAMDLATPQAFRKDPNLVWEWYAWRMGIILDKEPNAAHFAITKLQEVGLVKWIITQNVDSLHDRAGSTNLLEVHGNIFRVKCTQCEFKTMLKIPPKEPPVCECGGMLRPDVVWFGERLDAELLYKAYDLLKTGCDVLLVVGTSGIVYPVADMPFEAKGNGAIVIEFNVEETPISSLADYVLLGKSEELLPEFADRLIKNDKEG